LGFENENPESIFRAYSMANHPEGIYIFSTSDCYPLDRKNGGFMKLNPGVSSSYVSLKPGDKSIIAAVLSGFHIKPTQRNVYIYIAGMAPLHIHYYFIFSYLKKKKIEK
jgi:Na+-transporting NADH:ubiquinone oxidoreductase subunit F